MSDESDNPWSQRSRSRSRQRRNQKNKVCAKTRSRPCAEAGPWQDCPSLSSSSDGPWGSADADLPGTAANTKHRPRVNMSKSCAAFVARQAAEAQTGQTSTYAKNGADPEAVQKRLTGKGNCHCKRAVSGCHRNVPLGPLRAACQTFWSLTDTERAFAVRAMYFEAVESSLPHLPPEHGEPLGQPEGDSTADVRSHRVQWELAGTPV